MKKQLHSKYFPKDIEPKWREKWRQDGLYDFKQDPSKEKYYVLVELPYPSGDLHIGHWFTFVNPDILARFRHMMGENVFFPMGYDAFGLPAENAAIKRNIHPKDWTMSNIEAMTKQFQTMGTMIDWGSTTITCLPEYYKWNQWIFLKMFEKRVAYRSKTLSNWCPVDQTVLANEHVENGKCWRCGADVVQKEVEQWFLKITEYADELIWENTKEKLSNGVDWPQSVREGQNNWIGKSAGLIFTSPVKDSELKIQTFSAHFEAFTADTFVVIAPDHHLLEKLVEDVPNKKEILDFAKKIVKQRTKERNIEGKTSEGIFTGKYILDPVSKTELPIWVASYALRDYGTGIVKCSAHDERDFAFAKKYGIKLKPVLFPEDPKLRKSVENLEICYTDMKNGILSEPMEFSGKRAGAVRQEIIKHVEEKGYAKPVTQYHLHDWSISRQRYWGTPVPIINCDKCGIVPVPEKDLPVEIPYDVDYTPKGKPPLASNDAWFHTTCPKCGGKATRDAETLDTFFDSSWYYYRYTDPKFAGGPFDQDRVKQLLPVDIYFGGAEHTLGHTLYARFFTKFFKDIGLVDFDEFAKKRIQHGIVLGPDGNKMSKSKGNVINPDDVVKDYGADAVRVYLSFMMPYEATGPWSTTAMSGMFRFLRRVWDLQGKVVQYKNKTTNDQSITNNQDLSKKDLYMMHKTIKKVKDDVQAIKMNTAVAAIMEWLNYLAVKETIALEEYKTMLLLLAPFAPHISEELWSSVILSEARDLDSSAMPQNDKHGSIHQQPFPEFDAKYLVEDTVTIVVQVNGKMRESMSIEIAKSKVQSDVEALAKTSEKVKKFLETGSIRKVIFVPGKLVNFVVHPEK